jgi:hypothetical protein
MQLTQATPATTLPPSQQSTERWNAHRRFIAQTLDFLRPLHAPAPGREATRPPAARRPTRGRAEVAVSWWRESWGGDAASARGHRAVRRGDLRSLVARGRHRICDDGSAGVAGCGIAPHELADLDADERAVIAKLDQLVDLR